MVNLPATISHNTQRSAEYLHPGVLRNAPMAEMMAKKLKMAAMVISARCSVRLAYAKSEQSMKNVDRVPG